ASDVTAEPFDEKTSRVRTGAGGRFADLELQLRTFVVAITDDRRALAEAMTGAGGFDLTVDQALGSPVALVGTTSQIAEDLRARRERFGFNYIVVGADEYEAFAPVVSELAGT
ncbi:MAG: LLM class F420-dependent oxidoreductase, partial [Actinomycetia bacterium]|nr:LLM class F420-dependent oxidoreductase [Actinomycetes bacterium]